MIKQLNKDVTIDKYHNGYVTFPKGTKVDVLDLDYNLNLQFVSITPLIVLDTEQPNSFLTNREDLEDI